jgi:spermidine synthase
MACPMPGDLVVYPTVMDIIISEGAGVRYLHFDTSWIQGAMRIARPWALELEYTREMMAGLLLRPAPDWPRRALLIGLGAASMTKFLRRFRPDCRLTVVEIEPRVVAAARQHFRLPDEDAHLNIVVGDGADFIAGARRTFDLILVDGYDAEAGTGRLNTLPFFLDCRAHLAPNGLLVSNLLSRRKDFRTSVASMQRAFDGRVLLLEPCDAGNVVALATAGDAIDVRLGDLRATGRQLKRDTGLNLLPTLARLAASDSCPGGRLVM